MSRARPLRTFKSLLKCDSPIKNEFTSPIRGLTNEVMIIPNEKLYSSSSGKFSKYKDA